MKRCRRRRFKTTFKVKGNFILREFNYFVVARNELRPEIMSWIVSTTEHLSQCGQRMRSFYWLLRSFDALSLRYFSSKVCAFWGQPLGLDGFRSNLGSYEYILISFVSLQHSRSLDFQVPSSVYKLYLAPSSSINGTCQNLQSPLGLFCVVLCCMIVQPTDCHEKDLL